MENDVVIFWFVCLAALSGLFMVTTRARAAGRGWFVLYLVILVAALVGRFGNQKAWIYASGMMWLLFILVPGLLSRLYHQRFLQQRYAAAYRMARVISWLHPADGWRQQPQMVQALARAQQGDLNTATETLMRLQQTHSLFGLSAILSLYRMTNRWEELLAWQNEYRQELEGHPEFLSVLLRAHGEVGDLPGLVALYGRNQQRIARLLPAASRDLCRLVLFAFAGKRHLLERLFAGTLAILQPTLQQFWLATADQAAGQTESAKRQFEQLLPAAEPPLRRALERRLARLSLPAAQLDAAAEQVLNEAAQAVTHDQSFGAQPAFLSKHARATQMLLLLNLAMFVTEMVAGGSDNPETLYRLGALFPPAVHAGQWWRLGAACFLHWGPLHLAMNMFALWLLGPFTEFALGFGRFLVVYLCAGIGSMSVVLAFAYGPRAEELMAGASGSILGLVGATGALMLRGWMRERSTAARRRLTAMLLVVIMQTAFDTVVPQVSMTAHLSGVVIGFLLTLALRDNLRADSPLPKASPPSSSRAQPLA